jgi:lipopolysaccharide transport system ATP-binding protein
MQESFRVSAKNVTLRFRLYYNRNTTLHQKAREILNRMIKGAKPDMFTALSGVSLEARDGDMIGIIGPNGSGKTTLLRTLCGIYHPDEGRVRTRGRISTLLSLATGFDNNLSGRENIRLNGLFLGMSPGEIEDKMQAIIDFANVERFIDVPLHYYSSGMISRLSFSIVLAIRPEVLMVDEVFSVGDLAFQKKSKGALDELLSQASCQLIVTHNLDFVRDNCNRAIYLRAGKVEADGSPEEVVMQYQRDFTS